MKKWMVLELMQGLREGKEQVGLQGRVMGAAVVMEVDMSL